jgi:hypothetical protein
MGIITPSTNMPSSKFVLPKNLGTTTTFEIKIGVQALRPDILSTLIRTISERRRN